MAVVAPNRPYKIQNTPPESFLIRLPITPAPEIVPRRPAAGLSLPIICGGEGGGPPREGRPAGVIVVSRSIEESSPVHTVADTAVALRGLGRVSGALSQ